MKIASSLIHKIPFVRYGFKIKISYASAKIWTLNTFSSHLHGPPCYFGPLVSKYSLKNKLKLVLTTNIAKK
jgi:hypothetical protein